MSKQDKIRTYRSRVAEVRVEREGNFGVIKIPMAILKRLGVDAGDAMYWTSFDDTIQLSRDNPRMAIPVIGRLLEEFSVQEHVS